MMTRINKFFGLSMAFALAAFASSADAATKQFKLYATTFTTSGVSIGNNIPQGTTSILLLEFVNLEPTSASSVAKTILVDIPADVTYAIAKQLTVNTSPSNPVVSCPQVTSQTYTGQALTPNTPPQGNADADT